MTTSKTKKEDRTHTVSIEVVETSNIYLHQQIGSAELPDGSKATVGYTTGGAMLVEVHGRRFRIDPVDAIMAVLQLTDSEMFEP